MVSKVDTSTYLYKLSKRLWRSSDISGLGIPSSDVFYVRECIYNRTGVWYTPEHVRISMWIEGHLPPKELTCIPRWYVDAYMNGIEPDMQKLTAEVERMYQMRQNSIRDVEIEVDNDRSI